MMRQFRNLISKIKKNYEKQARSESHFSYLYQCKEKSIIPRGFNLLRLVRSEILWESNKGTFDILFESSRKLLDQEIEKWEKKKTNLENQSNAFLDRLKENTSDETFVAEKEVFEAHKFNVVNVENARKEGKILRDTRDISQLQTKYDVTAPKKKCRRFKRRIRQEIIAPNVENILEQEETL